MEMFVDSLHHRLLSPFSPAWTAPLSGSRHRVRREHLSPEVVPLHVRRNKKPTHSLVVGGFHRCLSIGSQRERPRQIIQPDVNLKRRKIDYILLFTLCIYYTNLLWGCQRNSRYGSVQIGYANSPLHGM